MYLIDSHAHLNMLSSSIEEILKRAEAHAVRKIIYIGSDDSLEVYDKLLATITQYPNIWGAVAFHPQDADKFQDLKLLEKYFLNPKVIAVGECGLDFYKDYSDFQKQEKLFRCSIAVAKALKKPLIIHSREAGEKTLEILKAENAKEVGGVFHCFGESAEYAAQVADLGFKISFTGVVTFKNAQRAQEVIKNVPLSQILVETDCPYMAPEPFRGKECEPMHTYYTAKKIAELKELSFDQAAEIFTQNTEQLFGI
ncbi:MAG: TatD family hydrolase [Deltaproteobacteria bacterium]|jgi:TatD DNase family protein|nr:TatD family hydrolase [Deltaproteobacteria bacterium]